MNEKYRKYIIKNWQEAEDIAIELGCSTNEVVLTFFNLITQPEYYWLKDNK